MSPECQEFDFPEAYLEYQKFNQAMILKVLMIITNSEIWNVFLTGANLVSLDVIFNFKYSQFQRFQFARCTLIGLVSQTSAGVHEEQIRI